LCGWLYRTTSSSYRTNRTRRTTPPLISFGPVRAPRGAVSKRGNDQRPTGSSLDRGSSRRRSDCQRGEDDIRPLRSPSPRRSRAAGGQAGAEDDPGDAGVRSVLGSGPGGRSVPTSSRDTWSGLARRLGERPGDLPKGGLAPRHRSTAGPATQGVLLAGGRSVFRRSAATVGSANDWTSSTLARCRSHGGKQARDQQTNHDNEGTSDRTDGTFGVKVELEQWQHGDAAEMACLNET